jgi:hypothetical protein
MLNVGNNRLFLMSNSQTESDGGRAPCEHFSTSACGFNTWVTAT